MCKTIQIPLKAFVPGQPGIIWSQIIMKRWYVSDGPLQVESNSFSSKRRYWRYFVSQAGFSERSANQQMKHFFEPWSRIWDPLVMDSILASTCEVFEEISQWKPMMNWSCLKRILQKKWLIQFQFLKSHIYSIFGVILISCLWNFTFLWKNRMIFRN